VKLLYQTAEILKNPLVRVIELRSGG
jgi:hypothetical protein